MNKAIHIGLSIIAALFLAVVIMKPSIADSAILLEKQRPNYWNYLATARTEYGEVLRSTAEIENRRNFIVNSLGSIEGDGYTLKANEDGTISFNGKNNGGDASYLFCTLDVLPDGEYVYDYMVDLPGITSYVEGINYLIGGGEERERFNGSFAHEYSRYECRVEIAAGFEGDAVIYPMLKIATDTDESYEPCLTKGIEVSDPVGYNMVWIPPWDLNSITADDIEFLLMSTKTAHKSDYLTLCFGDGTGICVDIEDPNVTVYGTLNSEGFILSDDKKIALENIPEFQHNLELNRIIDFTMYLTMLQHQKHSFLIAIKDEGTRALKTKEIEKFSELGFETDFIKKFRFSFLASIENGMIKEEKISENRLEIDNCFDDGTSYHVLSEGLLSGNLASIIINGQEYAMNRRGMNLVVVEKGEVIDTVVFDTCINGAAYRQINEEN